MSDAATPQKINLWKMLIPLSIGIGASVYLITKMNLAALQAVSVSQQLVIGLVVGALTVIARDAAFMYKLRLSAGKHMTWKKTFQTITMWEFCACVTPKISEAPLVIFVLKHSGLSYGKSVAVLMLNAFFDNMAFVVVWSILYLILGSNMLLFTYTCPDIADSTVLQTVRSFGSYAWIGYCVLLGACIFLGTALFVIPHGTKKFFHRLAKFTWLKRFEKGIAELGDEIELTAHEFKGKPLGFWVKMSIATFINWIMRYLLAVSLLYAFAVTDFSFLLALSRQYVLWIFTGVPTTPGATGVAEFSFIALNCEFTAPGLSAAVALVWRLYSYYLYIALGLIILPKWAKQLASR
ncbi:MAG TPA: lysylphosphatidylglycerol synthase transmembrane domain-containing protein [Chitinophagales bacterium]|nr:lysylphosphatidylglycerol synthase transmembrane domain-containing protein [Chitinophagales bacterium]